MTQPKGAGYRVILDLSYGDVLVNKATDVAIYDQLEFKPQFPNLDALVPELERLRV